MLLKKNILVLFALVGMMSFMPATPEKWVVQRGCTLRVDGSTNVNKFSCLIKDYSDPDTLIFYRNKNDHLSVVISGSVELPVLSFDCINKAMTSDLRKALKEKEFPMLSIHFLSLQKYPELTSAQETINGIVNIELAGAVKKYEVNYKVNMEGSKRIHLVGVKRIRFSDFNLKPPRKIGGVIKANDQLDVEFHINFNIVGD